MKKQTKKYNSENILAQAEKMEQEIIIESRASVSTIQNLTVEKFVKQDELKKRHESLKKKEKNRDKYGDFEGVWNREINEERITINRLDSDIKDLDRSISSYAVTLTETEYNECVCRALSKNGVLHDWAKGLESRKYNRVCDHVELVAQQFCERFRSYDDARTIGSGYDAVKLLEKNEYVTLRKDLQYFYHLIYGKGGKISANEVGLVLLGSINTGERVLKVRQHQTIMKQIIKVINQVHGA